MKKVRSTNGVVMYIAGYARKGLCICRWRGEQRGTDSEKSDETLCMGAAKYKCGMVVVYVSARCNSEAQLKECSMLDEDARRRDVREA